MRKPPELEFAIPSEHQSQAAVVQWAKDHEVEHPDLRLLYAVPNGTNRNVAGAGKAKREGVKAGVLDLCLPVSRGPFIGCYIEIKKQGGVVSDAQNKWIEMLRAAGNFAGVAYSAPDGIGMLQTYIAMERRELK